MKYFSNYKNIQFKFFTKIIFLKINIIFLLFLFIIFFRFNNESCNSNQMINFKYNNYINVAYAFSQNYLYITHCSMKSIMLSQNIDTFINFYILISSKINEFHISIINSICKQHKNCKIQYFYIDNNEFKNCNPRGWTYAVFYRLILQNLLKHEKKVLYFDCDTIIYKDLTKIYNYDINNKYYIGMIEPKDPNLNITIDNFINTGVLLINLQELRKDNIFQKILRFLLTHKYVFPINDSINYICHKKNGYFPTEFVVAGFCNDYYLDKYINGLSIKLNKVDILKSLKDPYIYHLVGNGIKKPWKAITSIQGKICLDPFVRFYEIARKTDYYHKILEEFQIIYDSKKYK